MVYSSTPLYLDPHNWHHPQQQAQIHQHQQEHQNQQLRGPNHGGQHHEIALQMPPPAGSHAVGGGNSSSIRPGSMADRARQAKIPQPEPGLKCPRCESTNTKFCYFNNYSLTQPRHFCKMCRRYWTRGGALRNVPVGGGCRRNKRSSGSSKNGGGSKASGDQRQAGAGPSHNSNSPPISSNSNNTDMNNNNNPNLLEASLPAGQNFQPRLTQFPLLASLQGGLNHHGGQYGYPSSNLGLSFNNGMMGSAAQAELGFQIGASSGNNNNTDQQWRPHHYFPNFLASFDPHQGPHRPPSSSSLYQFPIDHQSMDQQVANPTLNRSLSIASSAAMNQQPVRPSNTSTDHQQSNEVAAAAVKPEEPASQGSGMNISLSRSLLGMADNSQYWATDDNNSATTWTDLSGLNSSTTRLL
ncbi:unnamed protein product [Rhodiola kirilowii]